MPRTTRPKPADPPRVDSGRPAARRSGAPRLDAANLAGITTLMNSQHIKPGIKLDEAEKTVMGRGGGPAAKSDVDPVRIYTAELNHLAEELGIDLLDEGEGSDPAPPRVGSKPPESRPSRDDYKKPVHGGAGKNANGARDPGLWRSSATKPPPPIRASNVIGLIDELDLGSGSESGSGSGSGSGSESGSESESDESNSEPETADSSTDSEDSDSEGSGSDSEDSGSDSESDDSGSEESSDPESDDEPDDEEVDRIIERLEGDLGIRTDGRRERRRHRLKKVEIPDVDRDRRGRVTDEQERRRHINSVVSDLRGETRTSFGVEQERVQDAKASKLEQIGQLRMTLEEEGIDCSGVGNPTAASPIKEIDDILKVLRLKNDRNRYSSLAEEVILGLAEGIETVFDGSRPLPILGFRPDYTGYNSTVNCKLHRMRFETSTVVSSIIDKYDIGPTTRIIMELLPSFFLYPRQQRKQKGAPGLSSDPHVADARGAFASIHDSDRRKNLDDVRNL